MWCTRGESAPQHRIVYAPVSISAQAVESTLEPESQLCIHSSVRSRQREKLGIRVE